MSLDFQVHRAREIVRMTSDNIRMYEPTPELVKLFRKKDRTSTKTAEKSGRSFAMVRTSYKAVNFARYGRDETMMRRRVKESSFEDGPWLVPFKWNALKHDELRLLFWLGTNDVVINGKSHGDICSMCSRAIKCEHDGIGQNRNFNCVVHKDLLILED